MNILITAAGGGGTNGILETFDDHRFNFIGINSNFYKAAASVTPITYHVETAVNESLYINQLNSIIKKHNVEFVIPNSDIEVEIIAKHRDQLNAKVFLQKHEQIIISNDKLKTYEHCLEHSINVPHTISFNNFDELKERFKIFTKFPLWCRIKEGAGSKHTSPVNSIDEAIHFIEHSILKNDLKISDFTISDYLPGDDCLLSAIWKNGELKFIGMAHRMKYSSKAGQSPPVLIKKIYRDELYDFAVKVATSLTKVPHGIYNIDLKYDYEGKIALTEFNLGRFYYNMPLFNNSKEGSFFEYYINSIVLDKDMPTFIGKDELYFLRDQDNFPVVLTEEELKKKVRRVDEN